VNTARLTSNPKLRKAGCSLWLLGVVTLAAGCDTPPAEAPPPPALQEIFRCEHLLIAADSDSCTGDVVGPGELTLTFRPDPKTASWEMAVDGLKTLADECAFQGRFDQTRLSALQGRGETQIVCPVAGTIDRQYHTMTFTTREATPNTTLRVQVVYRRFPEH